MFYEDLKEKYSPELIKYMEDKMRELFAYRLWTEKPMDDVNFLTEEMVKTIRDLADKGASASAIVAMDFKGTGAEQTKAVITRALETLIGNGLIEVKPRAEWPEWFVCDPPYVLPSHIGATDG